MRRHWIATFTVAPPERHLLQRWRGCLFRIYAPASGKGRRSRYVTPASADGPRRHKLSRTYQPAPMRIQLEGEEEPVEVDPEQVEIDDEDPFLTQDEVDGIVESRLNRERRKILRNVGLSPAEFRGEEGRIDLDQVTDEEVFQRLADQQGIDLDEDGNPVTPEQEDELQELRQKLSQYEQENEDLQEKVSEYEDTIEETRETKLETQVLTTADGVRDGAQEDIFVATRRRMTYDDEYGWVATDENGNPRFEGGEPVGAEGVIEDLREEKSFYFRESSMEEGPENTPTDEEEETPGDMEEMSMDERAQQLNSEPSIV